MSIYWLDPKQPPIFPPPEWALDDPNGLLATGGALTVEWLTQAYSQGIFPWFSEGEPILWWSPSPRCVFMPGDLHITRRLRRQIRTVPDLRITLGTDFDQVLQYCAEVPRHGQYGTWITEGMQEAYRALHRASHATAVAIWSGPELLGGIYGVSLGQMFYGESMFSRQSGGSKMALAVVDYLARQGVWRCVDAQVENPHLMSLGARLISRSQFEQTLHDAVAQPSTLKVISEEFRLDAFLQDLAT
ncbi:leucyl/phenylalanyl-tRNA--protein transferase [Salinispirillum marinum]|uniref:Leucyl/phenylalanyl-tRNA--protein transferase n=2 Tax=Saccharospirillaceae TaxID=255527 RepID=A0ABV8BFF9_9GAMM